MPVRYVGKLPTQKGKPLYEICRQLANAGVGRVVYRTKHATYWPEQKSFYRLTKVIPDKTSVDYRKGQAWGMRVFRGVNFGECQIGSGQKSDWCLVPKDKEEEFCKITDVWQMPPKPPSHIPAPPWLNLLLSKTTIRDGNLEGEAIQMPLAKFLKNNGPKARK